MAQLVSAVLSNLKQFITIFSSISCDKFFTLFTNALLSNGPDDRQKLYHDLRMNHLKFLIMTVTTQDSLRVVSHWLPS